MTVITPKPDLDPYMVRGLPGRETDIKEQFQIGIFHAIASAAGCNISVENIDSGIDIILTHEINGIIDRCSINFQLKCTENELDSNGNVVVEITRKRYDQMRHVGKNAPAILIAQKVISERDDWVCFSGNFSEFRAKNYWLNLTGREARNVSNPSSKIQIRVPTDNVFDDMALVYMFAQHRKGKLAQ